MSTMEPQVDNIINTEALSTGPDSRRLGEILIAKGLISQEDLDRALVEQNKRPCRLGELLTEMDAVWEEDVVVALALQGGEISCEIDVYLRPDLAGTVPRRIAEAFRVFPVDLEGEVLTLATDQADPSISKEEFEDLLGYKVRYCRTSSADIDFALARVEEGLSQFPESLSRRLGARFVKSGKITPLQLTEAVRMQKRTNQRLGDLLVSKGWLSAEDLEAELSGSAV